MGVAARMAVAAVVITCLALLKRRQRLQEQALIRQLAQQLADLKASSSPALTRVSSWAYSRVIAVSTPSGRLTEGFNCCQISRADKGPLTANSASA